MSSPFTPISVLIGNLPPLVRAELVCLLRSEPAWQVVPVQPARGRIAVTARQYQVDLVIADESGMMELAELAQVHPVPVVLYSAFSLGGARLRQATRWNVHDYFGPWVPQESPAFFNWRLSLLQKLRSVVTHPETFVQALPEAGPTSLPTGIVVLGGSTGGSAAVESVVHQLLPSNCAILVAVHLPALFTQTLVDRLRRVTSLPVVNGKAGTILTPGKIIVVPGGGNTTIKTATGTPWISWQTSFTEVELSAPNNLPSIDLLMQSAVQTTGRPTLGVILSGLGNDGTQGARAIRQRGGQVIVQRGAAVAAMPQSVLQAGYADQELLLKDIPGYINRFALQARPGRRLVSSVSPASQL
ncbi:chemotaxis protein CheB [Hymenobacter defluvii]|uniref:protein-glutamate methylesterase n=1 Tax=Hymenobacter defluvii TaxID=2054411 RepID=A0ABS3T9P4_9BACT|nr:hypothetical protein [Hymenobacter defluvii]